jgi:hypothetical protein
MLSRGSADLWDRKYRLNSAPPRAGSQTEPGSPKPTTHQPTMRLSSNTTNSELRVVTQAADSTLQGQNADTVRVPASNADLPCDAPTDNHLDVLVPAMHGLQASATEAADTGDVQQFTTGLCASNMRTMPRVSNTWSEQPCCTARGQHGSPTNANTAPQSSTGDASSPQTPTAVTPVMLTAASGYAPGSTYGYATSSASGFAYGSASAFGSSSACISAPGSASSYGSTSTTLSLVITSTRHPGEEGSTGSQQHGFDPGGAAPPHAAAAPSVHRC